jgi:hypothetical protein
MIASCDPELEDSFAERFTITEITRGDPGNAGIDPRPRPCIVQIRQPLAHGVDAGLRDEATHFDHRRIVSYKSLKEKCGPFQTDRESLIGFSGPVWMDGHGDLSRHAGGGSGAQLFSYSANQVL